MPATPGLHCLPWKPGPFLKPSVAFLHQAVVTHGNITYLMGQLCPQGGLDSEREEAKEFDGVPGLPGDKPVARWSLSSVLA